MRLPVDDVLGEILEELRTGNTLVLEAPPGAGKTTRVPPALLQGLDLDGEVVVLEPRRIAARMAARRVAQERGEPVGETVGYQVRFEKVVSSKTRLRFVTEGVFIRQVLEQPELPGISAVVLDEFHERHLDGDLALALVRRLQTKRPDLRLVVMSATLAAQQVADALGAAVVRSLGRTFDVAVDHATKLDERHLERRVASAVRSLFTQEVGHILVFLPGVREIERSRDALAAWAQERGVDVLPLHGRLGPKEQDAAVSPTDPRTRRKVILATNVAETSVTIEGVTGVVDSGLVRLAGTDPWTGLSTLSVQGISQASAAQRTGRAGRTAPGTCWRLYTAAEHHRRREYDLPEIQRLDLASLVLSVRATGAKETELPWLDPLPQTAVDGAVDLLALLGALDNAGTITELGRRIATYGVHPRLGRIVAYAGEGGELKDGALLAAVLSERDPRRMDAPMFPTGDSDLLELRDVIRSGERNKSAWRRAGLREDTVRNALKLAKQLANQRAGKRVPKEVVSQSPADVLRLALLAGFGDRVAQATTGGGRRLGQRELLLCGGGRAKLDEKSSVREAPWVVALDAQVHGRAGGRAMVVRLASAIEPDWLIELFPDSIDEREVLSWDAKRERVVGVQTLEYRGLVLSETRDLDVRSAEASRILAKELGSLGWEKLDPEGRARALIKRVQILGGVMPDAELPAWSEEHLVEVLESGCEGCSARSEVPNLQDALLAKLGDHTRLLREMMPPEIQLGTRRVRVDYHGGSGPTASALIQDFFGRTETPTIAGGRLPLTLELLGPNRRPVQVTRDLAGFWKNHYPDLRKQLSRRYPRHNWPDDPATAKPTHNGLKPR